MSELEVSTLVAKDQVVHFLTWTKKNPGKLYEFAIQGNEEDAKNFIQAMRVHISRLRAIVKESGKRPKHFKILVHTIECTNNLAKISLERVPENEDFAEGLQELFV